MKPAAKDNMTAGPKSRNFLDIDFEFNFPSAMMNRQFTQRAHPPAQYNKMHPHGCNE